MKQLHVVGRALFRRRSHRNQRGNGRRGGFLVFVDAMRLVIREPRLGVYKAAAVSQGAVVGRRRGHRGGRGREAPGYVLLGPGNKCGCNWRILFIDILDTPRQ